MKIAVVSFTERGNRLGLRAASVLREQGHCCESYAQEKLYREMPGNRLLAEPVTEWCGKRFRDCDAILFVGACGIAVRAVAPWAADKFQDPAVLVLDEGGTFVIPLLSGHVGGANRLARTLAKELGATAVITTATDVNGKFAVDELAARNRCAISSRELAKEISAAVLAGKPVTVFSDFPVDGTVPAEVRLEESRRERENGRGGEENQAAFSDPQAHITFSNREEPGVLRLIPKAAVLGMGCRRGISLEALREAALAALEAVSLDRRALRAIASVDRKGDEEGLIRLAEEWKLPFVTFSPEQLNGLPGPFSASEFVKKITDVDCVCERAAMAETLERGAFGGFLLRKRAGNGVTAAIAVEEVRIEMGGDR